MQKTEDKKGEKIETATRLLPSSREGAIFSPFFSSFFSFFSSFFFLLRLLPSLRNYYYYYYYYNNYYIILYHYIIIAAILARGSDAGIIRGRIKYIEKKKENAGGKSVPRRERCHLG